MRVQATHALGEWTRCLPFVAIAGILSATACSGCRERGATPGGASPGNPALERLCRAVDGDVISLRPPSQGLSVLFFYSTECPIANFYIPVVNDLARRHGAERIRWTGVCVDPDATAESVAEHARQYAIVFPVVADRQGTLARSFGATTTPEAMVFDSRGILSYRGRIDDHYAARGVKATVVRSHDLDDAVTAGLAGKQPAQRETVAVGCPLPEVQPESDNAVTYTEHIAPLLFEHCLDCHRTGAIAPFALETYDQARQRAGDLAAVTQSRFMPPARRDAHFGQRVKHDRLLADDEIELIAAWAKHDAPEGPSDRLPQKPPSKTGWSLGQPDLVLEMSEPFVVPATGPDLFRFFVLPSSLTEDRVLEAVEFQPDAIGVVHHIASFVDDSGEAAKRDASDPDPGFGGFTLPESVRAGLLFGWAPGVNVTRLPQGSGVRIAAHADILFQMHYHPSGKEQADLSRIGLYFVKRPIKQAWHWVLVTNRSFRIPAGAAHHEVAASRKIPADVEVHVVWPHMHLLGKDMSVWFETPEGERTDLLRTSPWDFKWQTQYWLKTPIVIPRGSWLRVRAHFDNSADNPLNPYRDKPRQVTYGEQTTDEMCVCAIGCVRPGQDLSQPGAYDDFEELLPFVGGEEPTWKLWAAPEAEGAAIEPPIEPRAAGCRVLLSRLATQVKPWKVQVHHPVSVREGVTYDIRIRMKADAPRNVMCGVLQNHAPWENLREPQTFTLKREWQTFRSVFTAEADEPAAKVVIFAAGSDVSFDIGELIFAPVDQTDQAATVTDGLE